MIRNACFRCGELITIDEWVPGQGCTYCVTESGDELPGEAPQTDAKRGSSPP